MFAGCLSIQRGVSKLTVLGCMLDCFVCWLDDIPAVLDRSHVSKACEHVITVLRGKASFMFKKSNWHAKKVNTWAKNLRRSQILKRGPESDIAQLSPDTTFRNRKRQRVAAEAHDSAGEGEA